MADKSVAIRLGTSGLDGVKRDFTAIGNAGDAAAKRTQKSFDDATAEMEQADRRRAAAAEKLASMTPQTPTQQIYQAGASTNYSGSSARDSAAVMKEQLQLQERQASQAEQLRARVDPLRVAQQRYDDELRTAGKLLEAGVIKEGEHAAAVALSEKALNAAKRRLDEHSSALGLNRGQIITAQSAVMRFTDSIIAGGSPIRAFALEAHKGAEVLSMDDGGMAGGLAKVKALLGPTTLLIGASTVALAVGAAAWISYTDSVAKLDALAQGSGRVLGESGAQLEANAQAAADAGHMTVSAAREIEQGYLGIARSGDVLTGLTAITKDFAAATGQDAKQATGELGKAFADPIKGAEEMAEKYGILSQAQVEHIAQLVEEGKQTEAQTALLEAMNPAFDGAALHAKGLAGAWLRIKNAADDAFDAAGKFFDTYGPDVMYNLTGLDVNALGQKGGVKAQIGNVVGGDPRQIAFRARADATVRQYQHDDRPQIQATMGTLQNALGAGGSAEQMRAWTDALAANQRALDTWVPAAQKANDIAAAREKFRQATNPKDRAAARAGLLKAQAEGEVVTSANVLQRAADAEAGYHDRANKGGEKHAETLAREAAAMDANARGSIALADAYLTSSAAAIEAEARRKALTDATKKGIDVEAEVRRQLNLNVAEEVAKGAKSVAQLRDETVARAAVNDNVSAGTLAAGQLNRALSDEAALRPLLTLRAVAQGDALIALNRVIDAYTASLKAAHAEEGRSQDLTAVAGFNDQVADAQADQKWIGDYSGRRERDRARRAAQRFTRDNGTAGTDAGNDYEAQAVGVVDADLTRTRADAAEKARKSQADQLEITQAEIGLIGKSADEHDRVINRLRLEQQLATELGDDYDKFAPGILAAADATEKANEKLRALATNWDEVKRAGDQFIDDTLDPSKWTSWGDVAKRVLNDLEQEMIKLAILNPLKNALFGESNPTIGGVLGSILGHGRGGGAGSDESGLPASSPVSDGDAPWLAHNASGTENWSGGRTWVNENGPEIADLPSGTRIYPAGLSRQMAMNDNSRGGDVHIYQHFANNFAGGAATQKDVQQMGQIAYQSALAAMKDARRRAPGG